MRMRRVPTKIKEIGFKVNHQRDTFRFLARVDGEDTTSTKAVKVLVFHRIGVPDTVNLGFRAGTGRWWRRRRTEHDG